MISEMKPARAKDYIDALASHGRYDFDVDEIAAALNASKPATHNALSRLARQGLIASPARGFYVIVPPEYRSLGCLPAEQFIPALFDRSGEAYYAGLLTAAQYYGAAHQRPQTFQAFVAHSRKDIQCGSVKVSFIANKRIASVPVRQFNTPRGALKVSTPEATAIDLVGYTDRAGGLDTVATVLSDLADDMDGDQLARLAKDSPTVWVQRLGYLLDHVDQHQVSQTLLSLVATRARDYTPLAPNLSHNNVSKNERWKVYINSSVEIDL